MPTFVLPAGGVGQFMLVLQFSPSNDSPAPHIPSWGHSRVLWRRPSMPQVAEHSDHSLHWPHEGPATHARKMTCKACIYIIHAYKCNLTFYIQVIFIYR